MVLLSTNRIAWVYTADNGVDYRVAAVKALTDQSKLGGKAWTDEPAKPGNMKMRRISLSQTGGPGRVVPVYSLDAAILVEGATLNVNIVGVSTSLASSGNPIPEVHIRKSVTKQSA